MAFKNLIFCADRIPDTKLKELGFSSFIRIGDEYSFKQGTNEYKASLSKVEYDKEMYKPGLVKLTFSTTSFPSDEKVTPLISDEFLKEPALITLIAVGDGKNQNDAGLTANDIVYLAQNYYVQGFSISLAGNGKCSFTLNSYSVDRKMTIDKYCKVFSGKCIATQICQEAVNNHLDTISKATGRAVSSFYDGKEALQNLMMLGYAFIDETERKKIEALIKLQGKKDRTAEEEKEYQNGLTKCKELGIVENGIIKLPDSKNGTRPLTGKNKELKHPYLVQYNESSYDFIARATHRCGEFFYFEHGKIQIGLPLMTRELIDLSKSPSKVYEKLYYSCSNVVSDEEAMTSHSKVTSYHGNYVMGAAAVSKDSKYRDLQQISDENLHTLTEDDNRIKPLTWAPMYGFVGNVFIAPGSWILAMLTAGIMAGLEAINRGKLIPSDSKKWFEKHHLTDNGKSDFCLTNSLGLTQTQEYQYFADRMINMSNEAYDIIETYEESAEQGKVSFQPGSMLPNVYLGDAISVKNMTGAPASVVVRMHGEYNAVKASGVWTQTKTHFVDVLPLVNIKGNDGKLIYRLPLPARSSVPKRQRVSPMEAIVSDNNDPLRLGRVRVRYPWQPDDGDRSPWIRVSVPFAGGGTEQSGFCMVLSEKEHVMLDYVDGNLEMPFVSGSLYYRDADSSKDHVPSLGFSPDDKRFYRDDYQTRSIVSGNGHALIFKDLEDSNFLYEVLPPLRPLAQLFGIKKFQSTGKIQDPIPLWHIKGGGITLKDASGMCQVDIDPNKRTLKLDSCFGKVEMNAFTGITINAPNGDVTIRGKNIVMEAGNNITIQAGTNVANGMGFGDHPVEMIGSLVGLAAGKGLSTLIYSKLGVDIRGCCDFSYLRSILEILFKPVEGSLQLRSNRNTIVTAGMGHVTLHSTLKSTVSAYKPDKSSSIGIKVPFSELKKNDEEIASSSNYLLLAEVIKRYMGIVNKYYINLKLTYDSIIQSANELTDFISVNRLNFKKQFLNNFLPLSEQNPEDVNEAKFTESKTLTFFMKSHGKDPFKFRSDQNTSYYQSFPKSDDVLNLGGPKSMRYLLFKGQDQYDTLKSRCLALSMLVDVWSKSYQTMNEFQSIINDADGDANGGKLSDRKQNTGKLEFESNKYKIKSASGDKSIAQPLLDTHHLQKLGGEDILPPMSDQGGMEQTFYNFSNKVLLDSTKELVKKSIIIQILTDCGGLIRFKKGGNGATKEFSIKYNRSFKTESVEQEYDDLSYFVFNSMTSKVGSVQWSWFVNRIWDGKEKLLTQVGAGLSSFLSSTAQNSIGGLYEYKNGEHTLFPSIKKLRNYDGMAGPRDFLGDSGKNGTILMSSDAGKFIQYDSTTGEWKPGYNPDVEVLKQVVLHALE